MTLPGATWLNGIDLVAVERVMSGRGVPPALTEAEQRYACRLMTEAGESAAFIAHRISVAERTVTRWRTVDEKDSQGGDHR